jgi:hypothetical protein
MLLNRHATLRQVRFFLENRGQSLEGIQRQHNEFEFALQKVERAIPSTWRRSRVERSELDRYLFEPEDIIVAIGQDGLVANVAKYLQGQPVIGINPSPMFYPGILVLHQAERIEELFAIVLGNGSSIEERTMVEARLDGGQHLLALNEIFIGHRSHQSARYRIGWHEIEERQSSSGLIISTGTGSTGWALSIHKERQSRLALLTPNDSELAFFVREAWPSITTGTSITEGLILPGEHLEVVSEMDSGGVLFGDGIESDSVELLRGQRVIITAAERSLRIVT